MRKPDVRKNVQEAEGGRHTLIYRREFREILRQNPRALATFMRAFEAGKDIDDGNVGMQKLSAQRGLTHSSIWKCNLGDESFFVKITPCSKLARNHAPRQFRTFERVENLRTRHVRFENVHFAYSDGKNSFLVADYHELPLASGFKLPLKRVLEFYLFAAVANFGYSVSHADLCNCFYDEKTQELVLFDAVDSITGFWGGVLKIAKRMLEAKYAQLEAGSLASQRPTTP